MLNGYHISTYNLLNSALLTVTWTVHKPRVENYTALVHNWQWWDQEEASVLELIPFLSQVIISIAKDFWPKFRVADNITRITPKYLCQSKTNTQQTISKLIATPPPANAKLQFLNRVPHDWFTSILFILITCICAKVQYLLLGSQVLDKSVTLTCVSYNLYSAISHWQGWTHNSLQDQQIYVYIKKSKIIN